MTQVFNEPLLGQLEAAMLTSNDFNIQDLEDLDWRQYLKDFDDNIGLLDESKIDPILENTHVSPAEAPLGNLENGSKVLSEPSLATTDISTLVGPAAESLFTPIFDPIMENASSQAFPTEGEYTIPDHLLPDYEESAPFFPGPTSATWSQNKGIQPRYNSFRPVSAPPLGSHNQYDQFFDELQYDQMPDPAGPLYPLPPRDVYAQDKRCYAFDNSGLSNGQAASYPYQQISLSYPGSPTQPIDLQLADRGYFGPPGLPRQVSHYSRLPNPNKYTPAALFNDGQGTAFAPKMQPPPTSHPNKRTAPTSDNGESRDPKKQRIYDWLAESRAGESIQPTSQLLRQPDLARIAQDRHARSIIASMDSPTAGVDITKAVKLTTRRTHHPGRKSTIAQTAAVLRRNRVRRERYRQSLSPEKRRQYDINSSVAKGLITMSSESETEDDRAHDAMFDASSDDNLPEFGDDDDALYVP